MAGPFEPQVAPYVPPNPANAIAGAFLQYYQQNRQQQLDALNKQVLTAKLGELAEQHVTTEAQQYNLGVRPGTAPATPRLDLPIAGTVSGSLPGAFLPTAPTQMPAQVPGQPSDQRAGGIFGHGLSTPVTGPAYTQLDPGHYIDPNATPFAHQLQLTDTRNQTLIDRLGMQNQFLMNRQLTQDQMVAERQAQARADAETKREQFEQQRQHNRLQEKGAPGTPRTSLAPGRTPTNPEIANTQKLVSSLRGQLVDARAQQKAAESNFANLYVTNPHATGADSALAKAAIDSANTRLGSLRQQSEHAVQNLQDLLTPTPNFSDVTGGASGNASFGERHSANPTVQSGRLPVTAATGVQSLKTASSPRGSSESSAQGAPHGAATPAPASAPTAAVPRAGLSERDKLQAKQNPGFAAFLKSKGYGPADWQ